MIRFIKLAFTFLISTIPAAASAQQAYPDMLGDWNGTIRTVSSGTEVSGEVARGGAVIAEVELTLNVFHQDGEVFIGESRSNQPGATSTPVWGAIRSTGKEGVFVTATGGRGNIWFNSRSQFEFCFGNMTEAALSAYCGKLSKSPSTNAAGE